MDGIHDLGGMEGFGPIERDELIFHAPWERLAFALATTVGIVGNTDEFRHSIERLDPAQYLTLGYYGRWLASAEVRVVERGLLDSDEVDARCGSTAVRPIVTPSIGLPEESPDGGPVRSIARPAHFEVGQPVRALDVHPVGHTRLPRYVRGHRGTIVMRHPGFVFPDTNAHGRGDDPQWLYAVEFSARELWGAGDHVVTVDLFELYLEAA